MKTVFSIALCLWVTIFMHPQKALASIQSRVETMVCSLIDEQFPDLRKSETPHADHCSLKSISIYHIEVSPYIHPDHLMSTLTWGTSKDARKRYFRIQYHPKRFNEIAPTDSALKAALVHQLFHILEWSQSKNRIPVGYRSDQKISGKSASSLKSKNQQTQKERRIDCLTINLIGSEGLSDYYAWAGTFVSSDEINQIHLPMDLIADQSLPMNCEQFNSP
ncbi:MAG: hypothetical protein R3A11_02200 [Bdellovibrionota bacterium]